MDTRLNVGSKIYGGQLLNTDAYGNERRALQSRDGSLGYWKPPTENNNQIIYDAVQENYWKLISVESKNVDIYRVFYLKYQIW